MTQKSALTRLEKLTQKSELADLVIRKNTIAYRLAMDVIMGAKTIRPVYSSGAGRFTTNMDYTALTKLVLTKLGIEYIFSNDAPKKGLTGNLITITTKII